MVKTVPIVVSDSLKGVGGETGGGCGVCVDPEIQKVGGLTSRVCLGERVGGRPRVEEIEENGRRIQPKGDLPHSCSARALRQKGLGGRGCDARKWRKG